jgi:hypothetical protein
MSLSRREFLGSAAAVAAALGLPIAPVGPASAASATLVPRKLPFPLDNFGTYEPTISADLNSIYFARFSNTGDPSVTGRSNLYVVHRTNKDGEWPGKAEDWSAPERLPDSVNGDVSKIGDTLSNLEPWLTPDGKTLYFQSNREGAGGQLGIWEAHRQADGSWGEAKPVAGGNINTAGTEHCFIPFDLPGQPEAMSIVAIRPRSEGAPATTDLYTTRQVDGEWLPLERYEDQLLDSIALKCRFNLVTKDDFTLGIVSVHDFGKFHTLLFVQYDPATKKWKGPVVEAPFNDWNIDGACPNFDAAGNLIVWSGGYDRGPDIITGGGSGAGGVYDLYWLPTTDLIAFYKASAGLG